MEQAGYEQDASLSGSCLCLLQMLFFFIQLEEGAQFLCPVLFFTGIDTVAYHSHTLSQGVRLLIVTQSSAGFCIVFQQIQITIIQRILSGEKDMVTAIHFKHLFILFGQHR